MSDEKTLDWLPAVTGVLREDMPEEALSSDTSRGFELTSIKAAFVIERLNESFGLAGYGWRYVHCPAKVTDGGELIIQVALQYRVGQEVGIWPIFWNRPQSQWEYVESGAAVWSEPIFAFGGKKPRGGGSPQADAHKSALTDALTKAASMLGVGHKIFKGQVRLGSGASSRHEAPVENIDDPGKVKIPFGKHKGKTLAQVWGEDEQYFEWLAGEAEIRDPKVRKAVELFSAPAPVKKSEKKTNTPPLTSEELQQAQTAEFMLTARQAADRGIKVGKYVKHILNLLLEAGYENEHHRKNLREQVFGETDMKKWHMGWFQLLEQYALHVRNELKEGGEPHEVKEEGKTIVAIGVTKQISWWDALEIYQDNERQETDEIPI
jgi:hypothetical protein